MKQIRTRVIVAVLAIALLVAVRVIIVMNRPLVEAPSGTAPLNNKLDTDGVTHVIVDEAGVLSEKTEQIISIYNANWSALENRVMAVVTVENSENAEIEAWQWLRQLSLGNNDALLLIETSGNKDCVLVSNGTFREDIVTQDDLMLKRLTYINLRSGDFDTAVLAVCEELHYFCDYDIESYWRAEATVGLILVAILASVVFPVLIHMIAEKVDGFRFKRWYERHGINNPPIVPWKTIFIWHRVGSKWYEMRISGEWIDYRSLLREVRREAGVRSIMRGGRLR